MKCLLLFVALLAVGCTAPKSSASKKGQQTKVSSSGDAKEPASAADSATKTKFKVPANSTVEAKPDGTVVVKTAKDSELTSESINTVLTTSVPNQPPSQKEQSDAKADFFTTLGLRISVFAGAALFLFGLIRSWNMVAIGGTCLSGAGLFGLFVQKHPLLLLLVGLGVAVAIVGPYIYHTKIKARQNK